MKSVELNTSELMASFRQLAAQGQDQPQVYRYVGEPAAALVLLEGTWRTLEVRRHDVKYRFLWLQPALFWLCSANELFFMALYFSHFEVGWPRT